MHPKQTINKKRKHSSVYLPGSNHMTSFSIYPLYLASRQTACLRVNEQKFHYVTVVAARTFSIL